MKTQPQLNIAVVIIAGGQSRRFGRPKAEAMLGNRSLWQIAIDQMRAQTSGPLVFNGLSQDQCAGLDIIPDGAFSGQGPLAGLLSALEWGRTLNVDTVATIPVDTPFLPADLLARLSVPGKTAIAVSGGRRHPICGIWETDLAPQLSTALEEGVRAMQAWVEKVGAVDVVFDPVKGEEPFFNINTPEDFARAEGLLASDERGSGL